MVHLEGAAELFAARRAARGEARDDHRPDVPPAAPAIPVTRIDAELSTDQQLHRLLIELGVRREVDPEAELFTRTFDAVLFDLDGTLVDSTASVVRSWRRWSEHYGVSAEALHENHGQPARTLISRLLPPDLHAEGLARITEFETTDAVDLPPVRGAREFFDSIPESRRAIVTSGTTPLATARLRAAGFTPPEVFVTADEVTHGKPHPEPFLAAAERLGVDPDRCLVVEDAAAGVAAARAAGCHVIALTGTLAADDLHADLVLDGLDGIAVDVTPEGLRLRPAP
ncbi:HAD-IA family hydrolase [Microbacterium sp. MEC084]|nr:HAD-IA family hydrolase [Microbacterium sp. MEC084]